MSFTSTGVASHPGAHHHSGLRNAVLVPYYSWLDHTTTTSNWLILPLQREMPPPLQPPLWYNNTYLIISLCLLNLFTPFTSRAIAQTLNANFRYLALEPADVRYIWLTIAADHPPWLAYMASGRGNYVQVVAVLAMLRGHELEGNVPVDGEERDGLRGVLRSMHIMLGRREGAW